MSYLEDRVHFTCESGDIDERICSRVVSALSPQPLSLDSLAILSRHRFDSSLYPEKSRNPLMSRTPKAKVLSQRLRCPPRFEVGGCQ